MKNCSSSARGRRARGVSEWTRAPPVGELLARIWGIWAHTAPFSPHIVYRGRDEHFVVPPGWALCRTRKGLLLWLLLGDDDVLWEKAQEAHRLSEPSPRKASSLCLGARTVLERGAGPWVADGHAGALGVCRLGLRAASVRPGPVRHAANLLREAEFHCLGSSLLDEEDEEEIGAPLLRVPCQDVAVFVAQRPAAFFSGAGIEAAVARDGSPGPLAAGAGGRCALWFSLGVDFDSTVKSWLCEAGVEV